MYILIRSDTEVGKERFWAGGSWVAGSENAKTYTTWQEVKQARKVIEVATGLELYIEIKGTQHD